MLNSWNQFRDAIRKVHENPGKFKLELLEKPTPGDKYRYSRLTTSSKNPMPMLDDFMRLEVLDHCYDAVEFRVRGIRPSHLALLRAQMMVLTPSLAIDRFVSLTQKGAYPQEVVNNELHKMIVMDHPVAQGECPVFRVQKKATADDCCVYGRDFVPENFPEVRVMPDQLFWKMEEGEEIDFLVFTERNVGRRHECFSQTGRIAFFEECGYDKLFRTDVEFHKVKLELEHLAKIRDAEEQDAYDTYRFYAESNGGRSVEEIFTEGCLGVARAIEKCLAA